ncbi:hypothetical protein LJR225_004008 [Phenylobacterium sp. LjRoot225]|uniref:hypothetical protein n=1 Tax=Phenylobacterium sp. LjRoot225 TaxID=3342285 RepID=UPI003ECC69D4
MTIVDAAQAKLDINRVIRRTLEVLQRNWRSLLRPALLFLYLPGIVVGALEPHRGPFGQGLGIHPALPLVALLALIPYTLFHGGLIRLTVADLRAEAISTEEAMAVGRRRLWPLLGLSLLAGLGVALGLVLLIVPGVMLATAWSVAGPTLIEERRPVMETFGRSAELTRGSRLNIFGVGLILVVVQLVGSLAVSVVSAPFPALLSGALIWPLWSSAISIAAVAASAVIYDELSSLKTDRAEATAAPA